MIQFAVIARVDVCSSVFPKVKRIYGQRISVSDAVSKRKIKARRPGKRQTKFVLFFGKKLRDDLIFSPFDANAVAKNQIQSAKSKKHFQKPKDQEKHGDEKK